MNQCDLCPIRVNCDFLSGLCRLTPAEVARLRPDLIAKGYQMKRLNDIKRDKRQQWLAGFVPDNSLAVRYDKRRKKDSPRRAWERKYRARVRLLSGNKFVE